MCEPMRTTCNITLTSNSKRKMPEAGRAARPARARVIPDHEWEEWRQTIVNLYMQEDRSQSEIVEVMAARHNFVIR